MTRAAVEGLLLAAAAAAGAAGLALQGWGLLRIGRARAAAEGEEELDEEGRRAFQAGLVRPLREEDLMAFLFAAASAYFGWTVLYGAYGLAPVLGVVLLTGGLSGYGSGLRLRDGLGRAGFLSEGRRSAVRRGQVLFCWGVPLLVAAGAALASALASASRPGGVVWLRHLAR